MTRPILAAAAIALGLAALAQPAAAFSGGLDLPNLTFPESDVTVSSKDCTVGATNCTASTDQE